MSLRTDLAQTRPRPGFVGRHDVLARLQTDYAAAATGRRRAVALVGGPGEGKTRLLDELVREVSSPAMFRVRLVATPNHEETPLWPFQSYLRRACRIVDGESPAISTEKLRRMLDRPGIDLTRSLAALSGLLGLESEEISMGDMSAKALRQAVFGALIDHVAALSHARPTLLTVEDAHWLDASTVELLALLVGRSAGWPLCLVVAGRPAARARLAGVAFDDEILLSPLDASAVADLASQITGRDAEGLPTGFLDDLRHLSGGNALLTEEFCRAAFGNGTLGPLPDTLESAILPRLSGDPALGRFAARAACLGQELDLELLEAAVSGEDLGLAEGLRRLEATGLASRHGTQADLTYRFKHVLVSDTIYAAADPGFRRETHRRVVEHMRARPGRAVPELLAMHAEAAGLYALAVAQLTAAATRLRERDALIEASQHQRRAIAILGQHRTDVPHADQQELDLQLDHGTVLIGLKGYAAPETGAAFARAATLCDRIADPERRLRALYGIYGYDLLRTRIRAAERTTQAIVEIADRSGEPRSHIVAHRTRGLALSYAGRFAEAEAHLDRALALYGDHGDGMAADLSNDPRVASLCFRAMGAFAMGRPAEARGNWATALRHALRIGHNPSVCYALDYWLTAKALFARHGGLSRLADVLERRASAQGLEFYVALGAFWRAFGAAHAQRDRSSAEALTAAVERIEAVGGGLCLPYFLSLPAGVWTALGAAAEARTLLDDAIRRAEASDEMWFLPELHRLRSGLQSGDEAEESARTAQAIAGSQGAHLWTFRIAHQRARGLGPHAPDRAAAFLRAALDRIEPDAALAELAAARTLLADLGGPDRPSGSK